MLLRLKTLFLSQWNPGNFDLKFQETRFPMRYDNLAQKEIAVSF